MYAQTLADEVEELARQSVAVAGETCTFRCGLLPVDMQFLVSFSSLFFLVSHCLLVQQRFRNAGRTSCDFSHTHRNQMFMLIHAFTPTSLTFSLLLSRCLVSVLEFSGRIYTFTPPPLHARAAFTPRRHTQNS